MSALTISPAIPPVRGKDGSLDSKGLKLHPASERRPVRKLKPVPDDFWKLKVPDARLLGARDVLFTNFEFRRKCAERVRAIQETIASGDIRNQFKNDATDALLHLALLEDKITEIVRIDRKRVTPKKLWEDIQRHALEVKVLCSGPLPLFREMFQRSEALLEYARRIEERHKYTSLYGKFQFDTKYADRKGPNGRTIKPGVHLANIGKKSPLAQELLMLLLDGGAPQKHKFVLERLGAMKFSRDLGKIIEYMIMDRSTRESGFELLKIFAPKNAQALNLLDKLGQTKQFGADVSRIRADTGWPSLMSGLMNGVKEAGSFKELLTPLRGLDSLPHLPLSLSSVIVPLMYTPKLYQPPQRRHLEISLNILGSLPRKLSSGVVKNVVHGMVETGDIHGEGGIRMVRALGEFGQKNALSTLKKLRKDRQIASAAEASIAAIRKRHPGFLSRIRSGISRAFQFGRALVRAFRTGDGIMLTPAV